MIGVSVSDYLAAMAVMKVNYDRKGHDVLQMLVPFVADCARKYSEPLSDSSIQSDLQTRFGMPVPRTVIKGLLRRLSRAGALAREHGVYRPVRDEIDKPEYDLSASLLAVQRAQADLLRSATAFASRVFDRTLSEDALSTALVSLARQEVAPLAIWAIQGGPAALDAPVDDELAQITAQFVLYVINEGSAEERTALEQIAKGSLLSGVIWTADLDAPDRRINGLEFFLDTTLLLRLLGLCGPARAAFSGELTRLAQECGIALVCFEHNRNEILGILQAATAVLRAGRSRYYGEAVEFMVSEGWTASDAEEVVSTLDDRLAACGVEVRSRPPREARYNMDETELRKLLDKNVHYNNPAALDADVDSLASIFTLRRARHSDHLESSKALFVTTNNNLAVGSRQLYKIGEDQLRGVPLALVESQVASYLWARRSGSADDMPLNLLAMGALSIAESEPRIWLKYVEKLDELRSRERLTERDYVLLRQSLLARSILLAATDGNADAFTEDTADFVLKHALEEHARELQEEVRRRDGELAERDEQLAASDARAAAAIADRDARARAQSAAFAARARRNARLVVIGVGSVLALAVLAASIVSFPWPIDPPISTVLPGWLSITLGVFAVAIGAASIVVGLTIRGIGSNLMASLAARFERSYRSRFEPINESPPTLDPV